MQAYYGENDTCYLIDEENNIAIETTKTDLLPSVFIMDDMNGRHASALLGIKNEYKNGPLMQRHFDKLKSLGYKLNNHE